MSHLLLLPAALDPEPGPARRLLTRELQDPKYRPDLLGRLGDWVGDRLDDLGGPGRGLGLLGRPLLLVLLLLVVVGVVLVLVRLRRDPHVGGAGTSVFDDVRRSAAEHRALAHAALSEAGHDTAVVEGLRALAAGLVERQVVTDTPAATAREVADVAAPRFPGMADRLGEAARVFDETRYGERPADRRRAELVLDVEDSLRRSDPVAPSAGPVLAVPR